MGLPPRKRICRQHKSGLPKTSPNHKSSAGSPQCSEPVSDPPRHLSGLANTPVPVAEMRSAAVPRRISSRRFPALGSPEREEKRPGSAHPRRARQEQRAGPALPGLGCNGSARLRDAVTRDHGRDRMFPRHPGGGRSPIRAWAAAAGGPPIVRTDVASRSQAEAPGLPRPAHGRRGEKT